MINRNENTHVPLIYHVVCECSQQVQQGKIKRETTPSNWRGHEDMVYSVWKTGLLSRETKVVQSHVADRIM